MHRSFLPLIGVLLCSTGQTVAQQEEDLNGVAVRTQTPATASALPEAAVPSLATPRSRWTDGVRTPIHTAPDDPEGGPYGLWAAGSEYKASFHDGFTFIPYLGGGYPENRPFSWRTASVTLGGDAIATLEEAVPVRGEFRYEYRYGTFVERYDVRSEGVEQSFVVEQRPAGVGDLVVSGALKTELVADVAVDVHGELRFRDRSGKPILRYGAAIAFDADGSRVDVTTTYDGERIHLRVPAAWIAGAQFPVVIDPLISRECVAFWTSVNPPPAEGEVLAVDVGRDDIANQVMIAYTRQASATDTDMWVYLFTSDDVTFATRNEIFTDLSNTWGNASPAIAFAGGSADNWIIAFIRPDVGGPGVNGARYHVHASNDTTSNTSFSSISRPSGSSHGDVIDVGGVMSLSTGDTVFVVYERDDPGSNRDIFGKPIDLSSNTQGTETLIDTSGVGTARTRTRPSINQVAQDSTDGWVVAFQEYWDARPGGNDDWDINLRRITGAGVPTGLVRAPSNSTPDDTHKLTPIVAGANDRYSLAMTVWAQGTLTKTSTDIGTDIFNEVFDWTVSDTFSSGRICELTRGLVSDRRWRITSGTHDTNSDSHWGFMFESTLSGSQYASTTGFDSGLLQRLVAYSPGGTPNAFGGAVTFNDDRNEFVCAYASDEGGVACGTSRSSNHTVYSQRMTHPAEPGEMRYGVGCGPANIGWSGRNLAGMRSYSITLTGAPPSLPAVLFVAPGPANIPVFGSCAINVNSTSLFVATTTDAGGNARFTAPLISCPVVIRGSFYWQWGYLAPGSPPVGIGLTQGLETIITAP